MVSPAFILYLGIQQSNILTILPSQQVQDAECFFRIYSSKTLGDNIPMKISGVLDDDTEAIASVSNFKRVRMLPDASKAISARQPAWRKGGRSYRYISMWYCVRPPTLVSWLFIK